LIILGVDPANPIFFFFSLAVSPVTALTRRFPGGIFFELLTLITAVVIINAVISRALGLLEEKALKRVTSVKDFKYQSLYIKSFRSVAHQLYHSMKSGGHRSVLFTSALPGEGVSTVLANIAEYLAISSDKKVLIIDANSEDPNIHRLFRLDNARGLADVLSMNASLQETVQKARDNLFVLCAGAASREALEATDPGRFSKIIEEAEKTYDMVFIDCPNLKDHKDSVSLCSHVSAVALIVSEGMARREVLKACLSGLAQKQARFIGVILNNRTFAIPGAIYERA